MNILHVVVHVGVAVRCLTLMRPSLLRFVFLGLVFLSAKRERNTRGGEKSGDSLEGVVRVYGYK